MDSGSFDDTEGFVAGRSLDEWTEALFPGATMRTTARFDPDSPYSRLIAARSRCLLLSCPDMYCSQASYPCCKLLPDSTPVCRDAMSDVLLRVGCSLA